MSQFSLKTLLIAAAVVPLAFYALDNANRIIAAVALNVAVATGMVALVIALVSVGERQSFAKGFIAVSFAYAALAYVTDTSTQEGSLPLGTTALLDSDYGLTVEPPPSLKTPVSPRGIPKPEYRYYFVVGQIYWSLILGLAGGWFATWLYRRRPKAIQPNSELSNP